jgi:hypothetical protein
MPDGQLARVVYRSRSLLPKAAADAYLTDLLRLSRHNNTRAGLTGVLLFDGTNFLQAIEGRIDDVEALFETIACDLRHEEIELIEFKPIATRDYRSFPMAYVEGLAAEHGTLRNLQAAIGAASADGGAQAAPAAE